MSSPKNCWPAVSADTDYRVKVSSADTITDYLNSKIAAGTGITKTILNAGANEQLQIAAVGGASQFWQHTFLDASVANEGQAGMNGEKVYISSPNNNEWDYQNFDQNEETIQWCTWRFCAPFNWKHTSGLKGWLYWFVTGEGSHGVDIKWQWYIRAISSGQTLQFNQTYVNNYQSEAANDLLYITPVLSITPGKAGASFAVRDMFHISIRRQNDSASGDAKLLGCALSWEIDPSIAVP